MKLIYEIVAINRSTQDAVTYRRYLQAKPDSNLFRQPEIMCNQVRQDFQIECPEYVDHQIEVFYIGDLIEA